MAAQLATPTVDQTIPTTLRMRMTCSETWWSASTVEPAARTRLPSPGCSRWSQTTFRSTCAATSAGPGLHELAEREDADLLVVGSRNRGLLGHAFLSDDTLESLNGSFWLNGALNASRVHG